MNIDRTELSKAFNNFVSAGHGVVIGHPGAGKTHTLAKFCRACRDNGVSFLYLPVDKLGADTIAELRDVLGFSGDFVSYLRAQDTSTNDALSFLVIDAFDAARSEKSQRLFMNLIQTSMRDLPAHWRVIVSVRTYDARKSRDMLALFPCSSTENTHARFQLSGVRCRHFYIPLLDPCEVDSAASAIPGFRNTYSQISDSFRELLRTPFNLWLVEQLSTGKGVLSRLTAVNSEVELLTLFWKERVAKGIAADSRQVLATRTAQLMVDSRSMSVRKEKVYESSDDVPWRDLLSMGVLEEEERGGQRISFGHNILFDFAVSELLIEESPEALESFLAADHSRPLFLRPSLNYYFTSLWHSAPETFWAIFWHLIPNADPNLRLFARLLPTTVIARELLTPHQMGPLYKYREQKREAGDLAVLRLLQALKALGITRDNVWAPIFERLSQDCSDRFIGELATNVTDMQERMVDSTGEHRDAILASCGKAARNMLGWIWERRKAKDGKRFDGIGSIWLVPLVAKTFASDPAAARAVLEPVWALVNEETFPIDYLYRLTANITGILKSDSDFVAKTYEVVFAYNESSDAATNMGTPILPLTSNRRQDYRMCHYNLKDAFHEFLREEPDIACTAAVRCLTPYLLRSHVVPYLQDGKDINDTIKVFMFRDKEVRYVPDHCYIWAQTRYPEEPIEIADAVFTFLREKASIGDAETILGVIDVFCENIAGTYFWRELFSVGAEFPDVMVPLMWELTLSSSLQVENDTVHELGKFITAAAPVLSAASLLQIEHSLLALPSIATDEDNPNLYSRRRNRLLGCIGMEYLQEAESRHILEELMQNDSVPRNEPISKVESWSKPYSEKDDIEEHGVDLSLSENKAVFDSFEPLNRFTSEWQNKKPPQEAIDRALPLLNTAWEMYIQKGDREPKLIERLLTKCGECAETMARGIENQDTDQFRLCKDVLLQCANDKSPEPDEEYDSKYSHACWSPAPRNEAAQGLPWLAARSNNDSEIIAAIEKLTKDPVPSVRYLVTSDLFRTAWNYTDKFWEMVDALARSEQNNVVQYALCHTLSYAIQRDEAKACEILDRLVQPAFKDDEETELLDLMVSLVMGLYIVRDNEWAARVIDRILEKPRSFRKALHRAMLDALSYITPMHITIPEERPQAEKAQAWVFRGIDAASSELAVFTKMPTEEIDEKVQETIRSLYSSIDEVVMRFYFSAGLFERGQERPPVTEDQRKTFYEFIKPVLDRVIDVCDQNNGGLFSASTAHYFMELLNGVLVYDPKHVLALAHKVARIGTGGGYNLDSMAVREVVKLVESILANHRVDVRDGESLEDLLGILDIFSDVGWPDALKLVWRLDEVFR